MYSSCVRIALYSCSKPLNFVTCTFIRWNLNHLINREIIHLHEIFKDGASEALGPRTACGTLYEFSVDKTSRLLPAP